MKRTKVERAEATNEYMGISIGIDTNHPVLTPNLQNAVNMRNAAMKAAERLASETPQNWEARHEVHRCFCRWRDIVSIYSDECILRNQVKGLFHHAQTSPSNS
jgi:hypothetical protein